jgi:myo-inositol-1(or 4)-monophosphatase
MTTPREIIDYLLPLIATAGAYSAAIQNRVNAHEAKQGETPFDHALSDADLTIQSFIEVALLARFPEVSFFSEEQDSSLNRKYFPADAEYEVLIDPVDGTRAYIDGRPNYQVIVAIHDRQTLVGAIAYLPRLDRCYIAVKDEGAYLLTTEDARKGALGKQLKLTQRSGPVLVFNSPDLVAKLKPRFDVRDLTIEYNLGPSAITSTDLLTGRGLATVMAPCQAIDGGALGFIAQQAGAIMTDQRGQPLSSFRDNPKRIAQCVVTAASAEAHAELIRALV